MHDIYTKKQRDRESVCTCKIFNLSLSTVSCHNSSPKDQTHNTTHVRITVLYPYNQTRTQWHLFFSIYFYRFWYILIFSMCKGLFGDFKGAWIHYAIRVFLQEYTGFSWDSQQRQNSDIFDVLWLTVRLSYSEGTSQTFYCRTEG